MTVGIKQRGNPLTRSQFASLLMQRDRLRRPSGLCEGEMFLEISYQALIVGSIRGKFTACGDY
jgi:hypothetical protein